MSETPDIKPATPATGRSAGTGVLIAAAVLLALGWIPVATIRPASHDVMIGLMLGTMFGQVSLAAGWCALGPLPLVRRLPLAFVLLAAVTIAVGFNMSQGPFAEDLFVLLMYAGAMLLQWLLVQAPIWLLVAVYGLRITHETRAALPADSRQQQFGIRQLMILTALVAVVLGVGRLMLGGLKAGEQPDDWRTVTLIFGTFVLANAIIAFPLIAAALLRRHTAVATVAAVALIGLATAFEAPLMAALSGEPIDAEMGLIFASMNAFQCAWILGILLLLRAGGWRLASRSQSWTG